MTNVFVTQKQIAELYDLHIDTVRSRVAEMRQQNGKRYRLAVIDDGNKVYVNRVAFADWLNVRSAVKRKINVPPFDPVGLGMEMGLIERSERDERESAINNIESCMVQLANVLNSFISVSNR